jgi:hypothetical protein
MKRENNIRNAILIIIAVVTTSVASAQDRRPMGPPPIPDEGQIEKMLLDLSEAISLSQSQLEDVSDLYYHHFEEMKTMQKEGKDKGDAGRAAMENLKAELKKKVEAVLSPEQQKAYASWLKQQKPERKKPERP